MERIDLCDAQGKALGQSKERDAVHRDGDWHRTVHLWIASPKGELLLQHRSVFKDTNPSLWDISCAGHISAGQGSREALVRELEEELGLVRRAEDFIYLFEVKNIYTCGAIKDCEIQDVYFMEEPLSLEDITLDPQEVSALCWQDYRLLRERVARADTTLVSHPEEYPRLFDFLDQRY